MTATSEELAKILRAKNAELAALRTQLSLTKADLTSTQRLVTGHERTIDELRAEGRATRKLVVKYLAVSQEHFRCVVQALNFFLAYDKQKELGSRDLASRSAHDPGIRQGLYGTFCLSSSTPVYSVSFACLSSSPFLLLALLCNDAQMPCRYIY